MQRKHTDHCSGLFSRSSKLLIAPLYDSIIVAVSSVTITISVSSELVLILDSFIPSAITQLLPLFVQL